MNAPYNIKFIWHRARLQIESISVAVGDLFLTNFSSRKVGRREFKTIRNFPSVIATKGAHEGMMSSIFKGAICHPSPKMVYFSLLFCLSRRKKARRRIDLKMVCTGREV